MKLALFFLAEYAHMITASALMVAIFFGGYLVPGWDWLNNDGSFIAMGCRMGVTAFKVFLVICIYMIIRWTLPRFRFDQLMRLAWKALVPMTMAMVAVQGVILYTGWSQWVSLPANGLILVVGAIVGAASGKQITGRQHSLQRPARLGVQRG